MLEDLVKSLQKKIKRLSVLVIILAIVCTALIVFVLTGYEIVYEEYYEETEYEVEQVSEDGGSNTAIVDSEVNNDDNLFVVCGTALLCVIVFAGGIAYGKTKNHN